MLKNLSGLILASTLLSGCFFLLSLYSAEADDDDHHYDYLPGWNAASE
jgi:hypothetical protein